MLCTHKTTILCQFGLIICHLLTNSYLNQFSSIFGGNCIICTYLVDTRRHHVTSHNITTLLRTAAASFPHIGFRLSDVNARSLHAGGAMALLCGRVDADTIWLVRRWKSDTMFRYHHAQALPLVWHLAHTMHTHGTFSLLPGSDLPPGALSIPTHPP